MCVPMGPFHIGHLIRGEAKASSSSTLQAEDHSAPLVPYLQQQLSHSCNLFLQSPTKGAY